MRLPEEWQYSQSCRGRLFKRQPLKDADGGEQRDQETEVFTHHLASETLVVFW